MTDTPDWKPSEEMETAARYAWFPPNRGQPAIRNVDRIVEAALVAVRPIILAEERPKIEAAERERVLQLIAERVEYLMRSAEPNKNNKQLFDKFKACWLELEWLANDVALKQEQQP